MPSMRVETTTPVIMVSGDFVPHGGMDAGNWALARHLADRSDLELHLVAHRIHADLEGHPRVHFHQASKPLRSNLLGFPLVALKGRSLARRLHHRGVRWLVNGGNCRGNDVSWIHYLHAVHAPVSNGPLISRAFTQMAHHLFLDCERRWLQGNRLLFANSERTRTDVLAHYPMDPRAIEVVYYGADPSRFGVGDAGDRESVRKELQLPANAVLAVFVGALGDRRKGFDLLYEAWKQRLSEGGSSACLAVVGAGRELPIWRAWAENDRVAGGFRFLGFRKDVERLLRAADVMIHPARYEAYGLAVQEALCCGVPVMVSSDAGVAERFSPELRPLLLDLSQGAAGIVEAIRRWSGREQEFRTHAQTLGEQIRRWTWDCMARAITSRWIDLGRGSVGTGGIARS